MMRSRLPSSVLALAVFGGALAGCGSEEPAARPQWKVEVTWDFPVPYLADRLLIEVLDEKGQLPSPACRREAVLPKPDAGQTQSPPQTFGIEATEGGVMIRARLYRSDHIGKTGQPDPKTSVDMIGRLPPVASGVVGVGIRLSIDCIGKEAKPQDGTTCFEGSEGQAPPLLGSPLGAQPDQSELVEPIRKTCDGAPFPEGMACVAGGLFFLGDTRAPAPHSDVLASAIPELLIGIDSFLLDRHEVTVAQMRRYLKKTGSWTESGDCPLGLRCRKPADDPSSKAYFCTFQVADGTVDIVGDDKPVNCVSNDLAAAYCTAQGKRLPREAEWEFAAANGMSETRFPWDNRPPSCDLAWLSHLSSGASDDSAECVQAGDAGSSVGVASEKEMPLLEDGLPADRTTPPEGSGAQTIFALAGNVSEWTADYFDPYSDDPDSTVNDCWNPNGPVAYMGSNDGNADGPWCLPPVPPPKSIEYSVRGGNWREPLESAWSANRAHARGTPIVPRPDIGFRCAKSLPKAR